MAQDPSTARPLTPDDRRDRLRAFADRMLQKAETVAVSDDLPGIERAVRVGLMIERLYARLDTAQHQTARRAAQATKAAKTDLDEPQDEPYTADFWLKARDGGPIYPRITEDTSSETLRQMLEDRFQAHFGKRAAAAPAAASTADTTPPPSTDAPEPHIRDRNAPLQRLQPP